MPNTLFIRLDGPMQSWGIRGTWSMRDTQTAPTKSAVIGLLACTLGARSDETVSNLSNSLRVGVRVDRPGVMLTDYQTIGGGYAGHGHLSADGKPKGSKGRPHVEETWKGYLADASFLVAAMSDDVELIDSLAYHLQNPVWPPYLGRRSFPPALPLFAGVGNFNRLEDALAFPSLPSGVLDARIIVECSPEHRGAIRVKDEVLSFRLRQFAPRYVYETTLAGGV